MSGKCPLHQQITPVCLIATRIIIPTISGRLATAELNSTTPHCTLWWRRTHGAITTNKAQRLSAGEIQRILVPPSPLLQTRLLVHPPEKDIPLSTIQLSYPAYLCMGEKIHQSLTRAILFKVYIKNSPSVPVIDRFPALHLHHPLPVAWALQPAP